MRKEGREGHSREGSLSGCSPVLVRISRMPTGASCWFNALAVRLPCMFAARHLGPRSRIVTGRHAIQSTITNGQEARIASKGELNADVDVRGMQAIDKKDKATLLGQSRGWQAGRDVVEPISKKGNVQPGSGSHWGFQMMRFDLFGPS